MQLYLIRHPKPLIEPGVCYGRHDCPTENALSTATELSTKLPADLPIWTSPLIRCCALAECLHSHPVIDDRLAEMHFGDWEGRRWDDIPRAELDAWAADVAGYAPPGGESPRDLQRRALDFVASLDVPEAVIVTHAGVIRTLVAHWQGLPPERWTELNFAYGSCTVVDVPRWRQRESARSVAGRMPAMENFNPLRDAIPVGEIRRALVIKLRHHGDVLVSSPVFSVLKAHAPQAEIDALVYADTAEMVTLHPAIAQVHTVDRKWKQLGAMGQLKAELALYNALKARGYDLIIHLTEHWRGAWLCRLLKPRWSVGPAVKGRPKRWKQSFTHIQTMHNPLRHMAETNLDALRRLGIQPTPEERKLTLVPGAAAEAAVAAHLAGFGLKGRDFIHVHPASRWFFKCWPVERMAALVERLQAAGHSVVLTAAPSNDEKNMLEAIQARLAKPAFSLSGQLSLKELAALTQAAKLFIGVDSAPMHIAAAVGTPTVALFGPSGDKQWGPWSANSRVVASSAHPCRPCGHDGCGGSKVSDCLTSIAVDDVMAAAQEFLCA